MNWKHSSTSGVRSNCVEGELAREEQAHDRKRIAASEEGHVSMYRVQLAPSRGGIGRVIIGRYVF
jgi:hypothetical protein